MASRAKNQGVDNQSALSFAEHALRPMALGELHARPFPEIKSSSVLFHYAFSSNDGGAASRQVLSRLCLSRGVTQPDAASRYHAIAFGKGMLRWERHAEFTTFLWDGPAPGSFLGDVSVHPFNQSFSEAGELISSCRLEVRKRNAVNSQLLEHFDRRELCVTLLEDEKSVVATDFRQDANGMTIFLMLEADMFPARIGYAAKTVIELETYRTLALFGLPMAQRISSGLARFETELGRLTTEMRAKDSGGNQQQLDQMTRLAAELEAESAASLYRFGATRAYGDIAYERIAALGDKNLPGYKNIGTFLARRLGPALRTCHSVEERLAGLSLKLTAAADLLRTRVEVEMANQNRDLLKSMNKRARLQLRLQQTVEGLSVAAISYYIVGLFGYASRAAAAFLPAAISSELLTGLFVPVAVLLVWWTVRRIRTRHDEED